MRRRDLIGRKIVAVDLYPFDRNMQDGPVCYSGPNRYATNPVLTLDNGRRLSFVVQETDIGEYGVELCLSDKPDRSQGGQQ